MAYGTDGHYNSCSFYLARSRESGTKDAAFDISLAVGLFARPQHALLELTVY